MTASVSPLPRPAPRSGGLSGAPSFAHPEVDRR
jgi:hypothetical protein